MPDPADRPRTVLITGLGLMGGSLAGALTQAGWQVLLHHYKPETAQRAEAHGLGRMVERYDQAVEAELAVVCTPVSAIAGTVRELAAKTRAIITDVGSTKGALCTELAHLAARFVGSHPMCGSHRAGLAAADPLLYRDRLTIVTPRLDSPRPVVDAVSALWRAVGSRVLELPPERHDQVVAEASHLPHVLANLAAMLLTPESVPACAGGFRDTTRVAGASPDIWVDILASNAPSVRPLLAQAQARLAELERALANQDRLALHDWLAAGRAGRIRYESGRPSV